MLAAMSTEPRRRAGRLVSGGAIKEAATGLFLEKGYQATSMDEIAAAAQVSKQTIYTHFANKEALFADLVLGNAARVDDFVAEIAAAADSADVASALRKVARRYIHFVIRPEVLRLRRLVIGEAARFPELAREYYERVPGRVYEALADLLAAFAAGGKLNVGDTRLAAHHLAWLILGMPLDAAMFGVNARASENELDRMAAEAVRVFLAAYS
jgi:TetR/AcrR family transcriptional repressor of mexJK operon